MINRIKKAFSVLWNIKYLLVVSVLVLMGIEIGISYSISMMMGLVDSYSFGALGDEISMISNNNPDYIYKTIVDDGVIIYLLAVCTASIAFVYWINVYLIKLGIDASGKTEIWVEDSFPSQKEMIKSIGSLIAVCGITLLIFFISSFIVIQLSTTYEFVLIGNVVTALITLWVFTSMYFATTYMLIKNCGIMESIKASMKLSYSNKFGLIVITITTIPIVILVDQWIGLFVLIVLINTISTSYVIHELDKSNGEIDPALEDNVLGTSE